MARALPSATLDPGDSVERVIEGWAITRPELDVSPIAIISRVFRLCAELQPRLDGVLGRYGARTGDFAVLATLVRIGEPRLQLRVEPEDAGDNGDGRNVELRPGRRPTA